jgi:hypothetical protein
LYLKQPGRQHLSAPGAEQCLQKPQIIIRARGLDDYARGGPALRL